VRAVFVTGTDTGVGKTVVTAALAASTVSAGTRVHVVKPAQTGVGPDEPGDADEVRRLAGVPVSEGVRLRDPLAPDTAARREGVPLPSLEAQRDVVLAAAADVVLVEGAGGVLVRLGDGWDVRDLAASVADTVPVGVVVVVRAGLGTLNHAALTVRAVAERGLPVLGLVIGAAPADPDLAARENLRDLPAITGVPILGAVPDGAATLAPAAFRSAARDWVPALQR
jgi:dethiobiotin synthetase